MNIFFLSTDPKLCAQYHCDKHVVKMVLESAQMLCTAHRILDGTKTTSIVNGRKKTFWYHSNELLYKATHQNHPCSVWTRSSLGAYKKHYEIFAALCDEYKHRYNKTHLCDEKFRDVLCNAPRNISTNIIENEPPQAMPDEYKGKDLVSSYRKYYIFEKGKFAKWTNRPTPKWFRPDFRKD